MDYYSFNNNLDRFVVGACDLFIQHTLFIVFIVEYFVGYQGKVKLEEWRTDFNVHFGHSQHFKGNFEGRYFDFDFEHKQIQFVEWIDYSSSKALS